MYLDRLDRMTLPGPAAAPRDSPDQRMSRIYSRICHLRSPLCRRCSRSECWPHRCTCHNRRTSRTRQLKKRFNIILVDFNL